MTRHLILLAILFLCLSVMAVGVGWLLVVYG